MEARIQAAAACMDGGGSCGPARGNGAPAACCRKRRCVSWRPMDSRWTACPLDGMSRGGHCGSRGGREILLGVPSSCVSEIFSL